MTSKLNKKKSGSINEIDKITANFKHPEKKFVEGYQPRSETTMTICSLDGTLYSGNKCPLCKQSTKDIKEKAYSKFILSSDNAM